MDLAKICISKMVYCLAFYCRVMAFVVETQLLLFQCFISFFLYHCTKFNIRFNRTKVRNSGNEEMKERKNQHLKEP